MSSETFYLLQNHRGTLFPSGCWFHFISIFSSQATWVFPTLKLQCNFFPSSLLAQAWAYDPTFLKHPQLPLTSASLMKLSWKYRIKMRLFQLYCLEAGLTFNCVQNEALSMWLLAVRYQAVIAILTLPSIKKLCVQGPVRETRCRRKQVLSQSSV